MVRNARWIGAIITWVAFLLGAAYIASVPSQSSAHAAWYVPDAKPLDRTALERRAETAIRVWSRDSEVTEDEPANAENAGPLDAYDGVYVGMVTTRGEGRVVTFKLKVANGVGSGTLVQRECGVTPITLKVSPTASVTGLALMFSSTCLKTEMAIRGRAVGGTLQLRLGNQYLELSRASD
jgi:hypothetical protein